ncbi:hypothetical protein TRICI_004408 [Trichomonascus ciferrii]|uniref:Protein kinase domain-containing protein n=1 Tax=Trichomonascus ciferrii TaxID=44093 RepID=A0A642V149_9ASCO|nr:hypothetical protein TRICI_004408 [Trichomonascus ciferrii]
MNKFEILYQDVSTFDPDIQLGSLTLKYLAIYFFSVPQGLSERTASDKHEDGLVLTERSPSRIDRTDRDFRPAVPGADPGNDLNQQEFAYEQEQKLLEVIQNENEQLRCALSTSNTVLYHDGRQKILENLYTSILRPLETVITKTFESTTGQKLSIKTPDEVGLNGYSISPGAVASIEFPTGDSINVAVFLITPPRFQVAKGASLYFRYRDRKADDVIAYEDLTFSEIVLIENFFDSFNFGFQCCAMCQTSKLVITDGMNYMLFRLSGEMTEPNDYSATDSQIMLKSCEFVKYNDSPRTVRTALYVFLRDPITVKDTSATDLLFTRLTKTDFEKNCDRTASEPDMTRQRIPESVRMALEDLPVVSMDIEKSVLEQIDTGHGCTSQTLRILTKDIPKQAFLELDDRNIPQTAIIQIYDPYYYVRINPDNNLVSSAYQWMVREKGVYNKLKDIQGDCIPQLLGYGRINDIWNGVSERSLYNGPFILLEDIGNTKPDLSEKPHYKMAKNALKKVHQHSIHHNQISYECLFLVNDSRIAFTHFFLASQASSHTPEQDNHDLQHLWAIEYD